MALFVRGCVSDWYGDNKGWGIIWYDAKCNIIIELLVTSVVAREESDTGVVDVESGRSVSGGVESVCCVVTVAMVSVGVVSVGVYGLDVVGGSVERGLAEGVSV